MNTDKQPEVLCTVEALRWLNNSTVNGPMLAFASQPKPVGWWVLYAQGPQRTVLAMYHKPTDEQIKNTEQLLGWKWRDEL